MPGGMGMGGMGGMGGGLMGGLMRKAMGGQGMGGPGMGGMGMMGQSGQSAEATQNVSDVYDVDRWKRADDMDYVPTTVQAVRDSWDRQAEEKKKNSPLQKLKASLQKILPKKKAKNGQAAAAEPEPRPAGGTVQTPEMKKASKRINAAVQAEEPPAPPAPVPADMPWEIPVLPNYLGLTTPTDIDGFFTANPVNAAALAVDCLSMGPLTLNQVTVLPSVPPAPRRVLPPVVPDGAQTAPETEDPAKPAVGRPRNFITQRTGTDYMDAFHESREMRKYDVRIL